MLAANASMPDSAVVPVLHYADVPAAAAWLCRAFGFRERLRIGTHRVQLQVDGGGALVLAQGTTATPDAGHSVMVRVADVDAHFDAARRAGARIVAPPVTQPYGERQYSALDDGGHAWTFSQSVADVDPSARGGESIGAVVDAVVHVKASPG